MINYFLILFTEKNILIKNKIINLWFKSDKKETVNENNILHILKHYTNDQIV